MGKLRKMNKATGTYLFKDYDINGVRYEKEKQPIRYVCSCGCVHNAEDGHCPDCGNDSYIHVTSSYYSGRYVMGGDLVKVMDNKLFSNRDDPAIPVGKAKAKLLVLIPNTVTETLEFSEIYEDYFSASDEGVSVNGLFQPKGTTLLDLIEDRKDDLFSTYQHELWQGAKNMLNTWGVLPIPDGNNYGNIDHIVKLSAFMKFQAQQNDGTIVMPQAEIWKYRGLVWAAFNRNKLAKMTNIDDLIKNMGFVLFLKPFYVYDISGTTANFGGYYYRRVGKDDESKLSIFVKNSLLFAVQHGQIDHSQAISIVQTVSEYPMDKQEVFVDFFGKHIAACQGNIVQTFEDLWKAYQDLPTKPSRFDLKNIAAAETSKWMTNRGINTERISAFNEVFERDPLVALQLLKDRKKLSPEESTLVASVK